MLVTVHLFKAVQRAADDISWHVQGPRGCLAAPGSPALQEPWAALMRSSEASAPRALLVPSATAPRSTACAH